MRRETYDTHYARESNAQMRIAHILPLSDTHFTGEGSVEQWKTDRRIHTHGGALDTVHALAYTWGDALSTSVEERMIVGADRAPAI